MENTQLFPKSLLNQSIEERISYFKGFKTIHPILQRVDQDINKKLGAGNKNLILVYGPSGVGKSTIFKKIIGDVMVQHEQEMMEDKGMIPIAGVEAIPPEDGKFKWNSFYRRALMELKEPMIEYKNDLRLSLESALRHRKVKAFLIDEAHHISVAASSKKLFNQMDVVKSLANNCGVPIILFGTYDSLKFRNLSGQLTRRSADVHFPRYRANVKKERDQFINILWIFQNKLPLENAPDFIGNWDYFYRRSIGCVGILKDWIFSTYEYHLLQNPNAKTIELEVFSDFEFTDEQCYVLAKEATDGEEKVINKYRPAQDIDSILNLREVGGEEDSSSEKKKVGIRKPKRDPVGTDKITEA